MILYKHKEAGDVRRRKKKPQTASERIALLAIIVQVALWLLDKLLDSN